MKTYKEYLEEANKPNLPISIQTIKVNAKSRTLKGTWTFKPPTIEEMMEDTEENRAFDQVAQNMADEIDREIFEKLKNANL